MCLGLGTWAKLILGSSWLEDGYDTLSVYVHRIGEFDGFISGSRNAYICFIVFGI